MINKLGSWSNLLHHLHLWHHSTYCTTVRTILSHLHVLYNTFRTVHVPCFPVSDVEALPSTSVHTLVHTYKLYSSLVHSLVTCVHTTFILTKLLSSAELSVHASHHLGVTTISILVYTIFDFDLFNIWSVIIEALFRQRCQRIRAVRERS